MNTPNSFVIVFSIAFSIFFLSILQLVGIVSISSSNILCFSIAAFAFSIIPFLEKINSKNIKFSTFIEFLRFSLPYFGIVFIIVFPYVIQNQDYSKANNFLSLLSLAFIILSLGLSDFEKIKSERKTNEFYKVGFQKYFSEEIEKKISEKNKNNSITTDSIKEENIT